MVQKLTSLVLTPVDALCLMCAVRPCLALHYRTLYCFNE